MNYQFGPWATQIDASGNARLSAFWRRRLTRLPGLPRSIPAMTRSDALALVLIAAAIAAVPTLHGRGASAEPADQATRTAASSAATAGVPAWQSGQVLELRVVHVHTRKPLSGVQVESQFGAKGISLEDITAQTTDARGQCEVRLPDRQPSQAILYLNKAGFVSIRIDWGIDAAHPLPKSYTVSLEPGTIVGGVIQNEQGEPMPGVTVTLQYWGRYHDATPGFRVHVDQMTMTGDEGRWRVDAMPAGLTPADVVWAEDNDVRRLRMYLTHPDYVSDLLQPGVKPKPAQLSRIFAPINETPPIAALRNQTAVTVMRKGVTVEGRVIDGSGRPIRGASVGHQEECYLAEWHKTVVTTDGNGHFRLCGLDDNRPETNSPFSRQSLLTVQAPRCTPELVAVSLSASPVPLEISLEPGQAVHGAVVDDDGQPVEGVSIRLDYWNGHPRRLAKEAMTDAAGKFRIGDAPFGETEYVFQKKGHILVRQAIQPSAGETLVRLGRSGPAER